jgi:hypothetical protein
MQASASCESNIALDVRMARLARILGTDEGFFVLALHSFVESFICDVYPTGKYTTSFPTLLWDFKNFLKAKGKVTQDDVQALIRISREHPVANRVRHAFQQLGKEEAVAASFNFLGFCKACGITHPFLETLKEGLKYWEEKVSPLQGSKELSKLRYDLLVAQRENKKLLQQSEAARDSAAKSDKLDAILRQRTAELTRERARAQSKSKRLDALREELNSLNQQKKKLDEEATKFRDLDLYVEHLNRFSVYTRTRRDYERSFMRLTAEQQSAIDAITPGHDFLVRGRAGTGKTVVLLHAYGKSRASLLTSRAVLLTYTTTLVKYNRYLAELLKATEEPMLIQTAESFFLARMRMIDPSWNVDYATVNTLARRWNTTGFMSHGELAAEVEDFLFANMVKQAEYMEETVPRRGMRQLLTRVQRAQVWEIRELIVRAMEDMSSFSKNYSRVKLIESLGDEEKGAVSSSAASDGRNLEVAFVDESQDLSAADLRALKLICRRGVIMADDAGQAIYGIGSPYKRAGVDISGRTRVLRTDFRTTCPIHDLAEKYRKLCALPGEVVTTHAFREGPSPELYRASIREELLKLLVEKASLFIDKLGYEPDNITVLTPGNIEVAAIQDRLWRRGIRSANIRDESFSFSSEGIVRVSTLHSSKGLDFPVVLLYLPALPITVDYNGEAALTLARNLIYVALTRAMDNLNVFVMREPKERPVQELAQVFA